MQKKFIFLWLFCLVFIPLFFTPTPTTPTQAVFHDVATTGMGWDYYYADDDSMIQPYFLQEGQFNPYAFVLLSQQTSDLPLNHFRIYANGAIISNNETIYVVAYIQEEINVTNGNGDSYIKKTWSKKVYEDIIAPTRGMNPRGYGPYMDIEIGPARKFGEVRPEEELVCISYRNLNITFYHQTSKWLLPAGEQTQGGMQLQFLGYIFGTALMMGFFGGYVGRWIRNRAGIVPGIGLSFIAAIALFAFSSFIIIIVTAGPGGSYALYDLLLVSPVFFMILLGVFSSWWYAGRYGQDTKLTCLEKYPQAPPGPWTTENYREYNDAPLPVEHHKILSYTRSDGQRFVISEKQKDSWRDFFRRFWIGKGAVINIEQSTLKTDSGKNRDDLPITQEIYDEHIPIESFEFTPGCTQFWQKSVLGDKYRFYPAYMILSALMAFIISSIFNLGLQPFFLLGVLGISIFTMYDARPSFSPDKIIVEPVKKRANIDVIRSQKGIKSIELNIRDVEIQLMNAEMRADEAHTKGMQEAFTIMNAYKVRDGRVQGTPPTAAEQLQIIQKGLSPETLKRLQKESSHIINLMREVERQNKDKKQGVTGGTV